MSAPIVDGVMRTPVNWRVRDNWRKAWKLFRTGRLIPRIDFKHLARCTYCVRCDAWTWCSSEVPALTTARAFICEDCAVINDADCDAAWSSFCNW